MSPAAHWLALSPLIPRDGRHLNFTCRNLVLGDGRLEQLRREENEKAKLSSFFRLYNNVLGAEYIRGRH